MANKAPALVVATTTTSGTLTYTLADPASPGAGLRTLVDAVNAGAVANGDTVGYIVVDTTTQGADLEFERGIGTVGNGGVTLARTTIRENHLGTTAAVNWPSGGQRTVRISLSPDDVGRLAAAQNWTARQTVTANDVAIKVDRSGGTGTVDIGGSLSASVVGLLRFFGHDSGGADQVYASLRGVISDATAGSEDGVMDVLLPVAGADTLTHRFGNDGGLTNQVTAQAYAYQGVLDAPVGTKLTFHTTPPTGWTRINVTGQRMIRLAESGDTIAATGGAWAISGLSTSVNVNSTTLTLSQIPAHTHAAFNGGGGSGFNINVGTGGTLASPGAGSSVSHLSATESAGGGGSHTHTASAGTTGDGTWRPAYSIACIGEKS